jgi:hypothetical protein
LLGFAGLCGLRTRSEIAALRWEHIEWDDNTFTVPSVKTKTRTVSIFGDFRPLLEAYHQLTIRDDPLVVPSGPVFQQCPSQTQLTNRLKRTATKAGLQPWVRPWMNLRSSVETQLIREGFDLTTVSTWLGNSPDVARKHYLQVTPSDIAKAADVGKEFSNSFQSTGESGSTQKEKPAFHAWWSMKKRVSTPERTRTSNLRFRKPMLYPIELQVHLFSSQRRTLRPTQYIGTNHYRKVRGKA